nr:glycosyltransferase [Marinicella sp. W31]MDC2875953.1 hypothetical protein [Marinicella sp. W31]
MNILMYPARVHSLDNPFISILADGLKKNGITPHHFTANSLVKRKMPFHVHWLEGIFWGKLSARVTPAAQWKAWRIVEQARYARQNGQPVVWTVHNLQPHESPNPAKANAIAYLRRHFLPLVTDLVIMAPSSEDAIRTAYPEVDGARAHVVPHPNYTGFFSVFRPFTDVRSALGLGDATPLLCCVGKIRPYKGISETVDLLKQMDRPFHLLIAGDGDNSYCAEISEKIAGDDRFTFQKQMLSHKEVASIFSSADLAIFNFQSILNSGSVLAALSQDTPVLCPNANALVDLREAVGSDWVYSFNGPSPSRRCGRPWTH